LTVGRAKQKRTEPKTEVEEYLEQLPPPPAEHAFELKMEKRLQRLLAQSEELSAEELRYYSRQIMLDRIGYDGQLNLKKAKVCVVGLGGLGSVIATQLTAMGVGHLRLIDRDVVEASNLQRQHLYSFDVIGVPKVEAAMERLQRLNPYVQLEPLPRSLNEHNADELLTGVDVVVDGLDNMTTRYAVNRACVKLEKPYVFGSAISTYGNASTILPGDTPCLECFYGRLDDSVLPSCATIGVHPSIINVVASIETAETVKLLLGRTPSLVNKLFYGDISTMRFEEIDVARVERCPVCGEHPKTRPRPLKQPLVEEGCGRNNRRVFMITPKENLNLKMGTIVPLLQNEGLQLTVKAQLGVSFATKDGLLASILRSGVMIIEGAASEEDALSFYRELVVHKIGISWSRIRW
jgi:adenylyltransferase/sulfurtransferase